MGILLGRAAVAWGTSVFILMGAVWAATAFLCGFVIKGAVRWFILLSIFSVSAANTVNRSVPSVEDVSQYLPFYGTVEGKISISSRETVLLAGKMKSGGLEREVRGKVLIHYDGSPALTGARAAVRGMFYSPGRSGGAGMFDWKRYLANRSVYAEVFPDEVSVLDSAGPAPLIGRVRERIRGLFFRYLPPQEAATAAAVFLGAPSLMDKITLESFKKTGTMHILAVSGLHTGLVLLSFLFFFKAAGLARGRALAFSSLLMWAYILVTGARPSAVRAGILVSAASAGLYMGGRGNIYNSLLAAASILAAWSPGAVFTPSFLLSFLAVAGILYLSPVLSPYLGRPVAVSVSAVAGVAPVLAWNFHFIPLAAPVINLVMVPAAAAAVSGSLIFLFMASVSGFLGTVYGHALYLIMKVLEYVPVFACRIGLTGIRAARPGIYAVTAYYAAVIAAGLKNINFRIRTVSVMTVLLAAAAAGNLQSGKRDFMAVFREDGGSSAVLARFGKEAVLFTGRQVPPENLLKDFIYSNGVLRVKHVYVMHPLYSRSSALASIAAEFNTEKIFHSGVTGDRKDWDDMKRQLPSTVSVEPVSRGMVFRYGGCAVRILEPEKRFLDIRDNVIQAEIIGRRRIFIYTGGRLPDRNYNAAIVLDPFRPDMVRLKKRCGIISGTGREGCPKRLYL